MSSKYPSTQRSARAPRTPSGNKSFMNSIGIHQLGPLIGWGGPPFKLNDSWTMARWVPEPEPFLRPGLARGTWPLFYSLPFSSIVRGTNRGGVNPFFFYYFILVFWVCPLSLLSCGGEWAPFYILIIYVKICGPRDGRYASHPRGTASDHLRGRKSKAHAAGLDVFYASKFSEIWTSSHLVRPLSYLFICLFFFFIFYLFIFFFPMQKCTNDKNRFIWIAILSWALLTGLVEMSYLK